ncbi:DUF3560 domain-containing protein [Streptomyces sp. 2P-4]|uniref:DUF3560 domain-containing protein n=1 Tax=Streptomyces sp. 2P-4 TaxID=2931974 RepID=UPI0025414C15|nr:DUF3560 domain-containing protein [Streptomyces sp. 2P-4]
MATIEITHTPEDGTLVDGDTVKGDGTGDILKAHGFRWFRSLRQYGIPQSRDRAPRIVAIENAADALRAAGHTVTVDVSTAVRDNATVQDTTHKRLEDRRAALTAKGEKLARTADALYRASDAMVAHLPLGQPVAPGRKGRAHRNLLERSVDTAIRSALTAQEAERMPARVAGSIRAEAEKQRPDVVARRVARREAELRRLDRQMQSLAEHHPEATSGRLYRQYEGQRAELVERIDGDRAVLEQAKQAGTFGRYSKDNVRKGDLVRVRGQWRQVARANAKTVGVTTGYSWTDKYGWEEVTGHRPADS